MIIAGIGGAEAQSKQKKAPAQAAQEKQKQSGAVIQIPLTEKQILGFVASTKEIREITETDQRNLDEDGPETFAKIEGIIRKNGLANYPEYKSVLENATLVAFGFDWATKRYIGNAAVAKAMMAEMNADKKMSSEQKENQLATISELLRTPAIRYRANINVVGKYLDQIIAALPSGKG